MIWVIAVVVIVWVVYIIYDNHNSKKIAEMQKQIIKAEEKFYDLSHKYGEATSLIKDPLEAHRNYVAFIREANKIIIHTVDASNWMCDPLIL